MGGLCNQWNGRFSLGNPIDQGDANLDKDRPEKERMEGSPNQDGFDWKSFYRSVRRLRSQPTKKATAANAVNPSRTRQIVIGL